MWTWILSCCQSESRDMCEDCGCCLKLIVSLNKSLLAGPPPTYPFSSSVRAVAQSRCFTQMFHCCRCSHSVLREQRPSCPDWSAKDRRTVAGSETAGWGFVVVFVCDAGALWGHLTCESLWEHLCTPAHLRPPACLCPAGGWVRADGSVSETSCSGGSASSLSGLCGMWSASVKQLFIPNLNRTKCFGCDSVTFDLLSADDPIRPVCSCGNAEQQLIYQLSDEAELRDSLGERPQSHSQALSCTQLRARPPPLTVACRDPGFCTWIFSVLDFWFWFI